MFDLAKVQSALREFGLDGWLLYDFRGSNILARRVLNLDQKHFGSRRWLYWIPSHGSPLRIVHRIEDSSLDSLPGGKTIYLTWQELESAIRGCVTGVHNVAMEYSPKNGNPYVSKVDAGVIELVRSFGCTVQSSGDIVQLFEATLSDEQIKSHYDAAVQTNAAYDIAWKFIADKVRSEGGVEEIAVQDVIMEHFRQHNMTTYSPPIVARNAHSGMPHYETDINEESMIRAGDFVLIDLWAKLKDEGSIYSDLTRTGFVGETVPDKYTKIFKIVAAARDAGITLVIEAFNKHIPIRGFEVDNAVRKVITDAGYGQFFVHRTGHNIGQDVHGYGANIDGLETRDERRLLPRTCFSIEPGIYQPDFGVRSEVNMLIDEHGKAHLTGGPLQTAIVPILTK